MIQPRGKIRRRHVEPADHARDKPGPRREIKQKVGLGLGFGGLHQNGPGDAGGGVQRRQILGGEIPEKAAQIGGQPAVIAAIHLPEMLMCVDHVRITPFFRIRLA